MGASFRQCAPRAKVSRYVGQVCFLLPDTQIANENFVEEAEAGLATLAVRFESSARKVSGLLNTGEVPNLFNAEEIETP